MADAGNPISLNVLVFASMSPVEWKQLKPFNTEIAILSIGIGKRFDLDHPVCLE